jgi:hypothetical protein
VTLKILIGRFSRIFFSGTAEGIELKSGRWQNFQIKFTIPTDQLVKLTTH